MAAHCASNFPDAPDPAPTAPASDGTKRRPTIFLHIGEPKTGTTFLQQIMWRNRGELAGQGLALPGHHPQDHYRASQDLRGIAKLAADPVGDWTGEWDILASQARQAHGATVISHELFSAADAAQADRAVRSLHPADVHIVLTVRDMATLLPAEWQETVKHRNFLGWEEWLEDVIDRESVADDRRQFWFWRVHDTMAILKMWSRHLPPGNVHVITTAARGSSTDVLWHRFAGLLGVDPASVDLSRARANTSLGLPEIEFMRRLNQALPDEVPDWFYMRNVKETLAHRTLAARPRDGRLLLPAGRETWAKEQAQLLAAGLRESGYDIIGDLSELDPPPVSEPPSSPAGQPADQILDAAVESAAALVVHMYRRAHPAARPQQDHGVPRGLVSRVESTVAASPRLKRTVRQLSSRHPAVRRLRIVAWRVLERPRVRKQP